MPSSAKRRLERVDDLHGELAQAGVHDRRVLALEQARCGRSRARALSATPGSSSAKIRRGLAPRTRGSPARRPTRSAIERMPFAAMSAATRRSSSAVERRDLRARRTRGRRGRGRCGCRAPRAGAPASRPCGGSACVAGSPRRTAAVGISRFASTTAFVKCVVPIITAWSAPGRRSSASTIRLRSAADDAARDVRGRRGLHGCEHAHPVHQDGVRVRAAYVDADAHSRSPSSSPVGDGRRESGSGQFYPISRRGSTDLTFRFILWLALAGMEAAHW